MPAKSPTSVVAAVIERNGSILICQRRSDDSHPFKWEFPGGKVEPGESLEGALRRELTEELAIHARIGPRVTGLTHRYAGYRPVQLTFFRVREFEGEPQNRVFERILWVEPSRLIEFDFLEADTALVRTLVGA